MRADLLILLVCADAFFFAQMEKEMLEEEERKEKERQDRRPEGFASEDKEGDKEEG